MVAAGRPAAFEIAAFEAVDMLQLPNRPGHLVPCANCSVLEAPCTSVLPDARRQSGIGYPILEVEPLGQEVNQWGNQRRHL